jgi:hypothetical protein
MSTTPRAALLVAVTVLALAGLYVLFRTAGSEPSTVGAQPRMFELSIVNQRLVDGSATLSAPQSEQITLVITTDRPGELHIHGHGQEIALEPNREARLTFRAERVGRYPIELHSHGGETSLAAIEVQPRP